MKRFSFRYESSVTLSAPVTTHSWLLRALPREEQFQHLEWDSLRVEASLPDGSTVEIPVSAGTDAFGSRIQFGCIEPPHVRMTMIAEGAVSQSPYRIDAPAHGMYAAPTVLASPSDEMIAFAQGLELDKSNSITDKALTIANAVHSRMIYAPGSTRVETTAAQAFALGRGVCQDYAHITLALMRHAGIAARYVCGFLAGEGATHAWVEYFDSGVWLALDPTHGRAVDYGCIKVAHGRDSSDCTVNRGIFTGCVQQKNSVSIKVEEL
ncbi:MAG: transglutaminase family protein [Mailhella sp.]|nr:transglutaminase family protein [Mailhella sp.]